MYVHVHIYGDDEDVGKTARNANIKDLAHLRLRCA